MSDNMSRGTIKAGELAGDVGYSPHIEGASFEPLPSLNFGQSDRLALMPESMQQGAIRDPWHRPVEQLEREVDRDVMFLNDWLHHNSPCAQGIDEIAVMFRTREELWGWITGAVQEPGVTVFNYAEDRVKTEPIVSSYEVEYTFLRREQVPWRIEAMMIRQGSSPYHSSLRGQGRVVHASFRCSDVPQYDNVIDAMWERGDVELVQRCESTYGKFSYWRVAGSGLLLKPRVNLRDQ